MTGLLAAHAAAATQPAASPGQEEPSEIVVTGAAPVTRAGASQFIAAIMAEPVNDRVARWDRRICVTIEGAGATHRDFFMLRLAAIGAALGVAIVPNRRCEASATIIFADDAAAFIARLAQDRPDFFRDILPSARATFLASSAPVRWLSQAELRGPNGERPLGFTLDPRFNTSVRPVPSTRASASRLQAGSRLDLQSMLVLVDMSKIAGVSNRAMSAYLAMVVFGNLRPDPGAIGRPSILDIFSPRPDYAAPSAVDLTTWDHSYLRSLYGGSWALSADQRTAAIGASMGRHLRADDGDRDRSSGLR